VWFAALDWFSHSLRLILPEKGGSAVTHPSERASDVRQPLLVCKRCARNLVPGHGDLYVVSIVALADPSTLELTESELARDAAREIRYLIAQMKHLSAEAAEDQVHRQMVFHLCGTCYHQWIVHPTGV
jgi:hypothetical protein